MKTCSQFESCALVAMLKPDFPKAMELLKRKYCAADHVLCAIFQKGGIQAEDSLIYQNIAWVRTLIEAEITGLTKEPLS